MAFGIAGIGLRPARSREIEQRPGGGTYGSRSLVVGGAALFKATGKVIEKGKKIAAHQSEVSEVDVEFADGWFAVAGTDRRTSFRDIAGAAYVPGKFPLETLEPGLEERAYYDPVNFTFPGGGDRHEQCGGDERRSEK